jgi:CheY-like chemotaxis protein
MTRNATTAEDRDHLVDPTHALLKRVLIVEDDPYLVTAFSRSLRGAGYDVLSENRGIDGLETAVRSDPDLILLDLALPGMRASKMLHELRQRAPHIPVVAMRSGADTPAGAPHQVLGHVPVPCSEADLLEQVRAALGEG